MAQLKTIYGGVNMNTKILNVLLWILFINISFSQTKLSPFGFIKFDGFYDTKEVVSAREGHILLYPTNNQDESPHLNFVLFQTRLGLKIKSNTIGGAKVTGIIEGDFFGTANGMENTFRLRQSYVSLNWEKSSLLFGQTWTPLFTTSVYPKVISFNTGIPFQPFARMPQIRLTRNMSKKIEMLAALTMQRDAYQEIGGNEQQIKSGLPGVHFHIRLKGEHYLFGLGNHYRTIVPNESSEKLSSSVWTLYGKFENKQLGIRWKTLFGEDMADHLMLGGYTVNEVYGVREYQALKLASHWLDLRYSKGLFIFGLFTGFSENLGVETEIESREFVSLSARSPNIKNIFRLSGSIAYKVEKVQFAVELESTTASYTSSYDSFLVPKALPGDLSVSNLRILFSSYLFF